MKQSLFVLLITLLPFCLLAQSNSAHGRWGVEITSSLHNELTPIRLGPTLTYTKGNNQYNMGVSMAPSTSNGQRILSVDYRNKHFLNGTDQKYSLYLTTGASYIRNERETFFPTTYNYLFFDAGYGFQVNVIGGMYLGTNVIAGLFTYQRNTENPLEGFASTRLFEEWGFQLGFQFNMGYRF